MGVPLITGEIAWRPQDGVVSPDTLCGLLLEYPAAAPGIPMPAVCNVLYSLACSIVPSQRPNEERSDMIESGNRYCTSPFTRELQDVRDLFLWCIMIQTFRACIGPDIDGILTLISIGCIASLVLCVLAATPFKQGFRLKHSWFSSPFLGPSPSISCIFLQRLFPSPVLSHSQFVFI